ncbi:hypothetical protein [Brumimicrobium mesophilum]|uniref:hypothetical protein n=1 Tax=Brumimicrobium mesophilum TaxID=392717 RepID=UPI000D142F5A|nr:hypothetical protein [Brumimicrobium mesophilum]
MKFRSICLLLISCAFIVSCSDQEQVKIVNDKIEPPFKKQILDWSVMNAQGWKNMSFPTWFSKELIDSNNIESVFIGFTNFNFTDSILNMTDTLPHRTVEIQFGKFGSVDKVELSDYINGILLAQHIFSYKFTTDSLGYSTPAISSNVKYREKSMISLLTTLQELQQYHRLVLQESNSDLITYIDKSNKNGIAHYFILDSANWNVSYIDQNLKSEKNNIFYFGSPTNYSSSFSVKNLVEKTMKQTREYYVSNALKNQYFYSKDFITKRSYHYDNEGMLIEMNDSLVTSSNEFLHAEYAKIHYNNSLPKSITFFNEEDSLMKTPIKRIGFDYSITK